MDEHQGVIEREFERMLSSATFLTLDLRRLSAFSLWLADALPEWTERERNDRAPFLIFEAALRPAAEVQDGRKVRQPLLAAKHLLGLGAYNALSLDEIVQDTDQSLKFFKDERGRIIPRDHPLDDLGLRQRIASNAANYGSDRSNATKRLSAIAGALWLEVQQVVKEPDLRSVLTARRASVMEQRKKYADYVRVRTEVTKRAQVTEAAIVEKKTADAPPKPMIKAKPRHTRRFWTITAIASVLILIAGSLGVWRVVALTSELPAVTVTQTSVIRPYTNGPSPISSDIPQVIKMTCSRTSLVSLRNDAHLCTGGDLYPLYDPCFDVMDGVVDCPHVRMDGDGTAHIDSAYFQVRSMETFYFDAANEKATVPASSDTEAFYPWAIIVRKGGYNVPCEVRFDSGESPTLPVSYTCPQGPIQLVHSVRGLIDGSDTNFPTFTLPWLTTAFDLDKSQPVWTIRAADPSSASEFNNVPVVQAFF